MLKQWVQCNEKRNPICFAVYNVVEMSENGKKISTFYPTFLDFELYNARFMADVLFYH